jgi:hypothetical protein
MQYSTLQYQDLEQKREIIGMSIRFKDVRRYKEIDSTNKNGL